MCIWESGFAANHETPPAYLFFYEIEVGIAVGMIRSAALAGREEAHL